MLIYGVTSAAQLVEDVLRACLPSLCLLVIWLELDYFSDDHRCFGDIKAISAGDIDPRAVLACMELRAPKRAAICCDCDDLLHDWADGGGARFWKKAEAIVHGQRQRLQ
jgi:hypothetical protein